MDSGVAVFFNQDGNFLLDIPHYCTLTAFALHDDAPLRIDAPPPLFFPPAYPANDAGRDREEAARECGKPSWGHAERKGQSPGMNNILCARSGLPRAWQMLKYHEGAGNVVNLTMR